MVTNEHVTESLPAYTLGALDDVEAREVEEHLAGCATCRQALTAYENVAGQLAHAVPRREPPPDLKRKVMAGIAAADVTVDPAVDAGGILDTASGTVADPAPTRESADTAPQEGWLQTLRRFFAGPVWQPALLILVVLLGAVNVALWQRVQEAQDAAPFRTVRLAGTENASGATGVIIISEDGEHGALIVQELPQLSEEQEYQLWLSDDGERADGGTFSVDEDGYDSHYVSSPQPLDEYDTFGVTIEPAGGSPGPTGPQVLGNRR